MAADDARARIIDAAGPFFAEKGYEATTVREICEKAGVNLASVNYYFGGKEPLYVETFKRAHPTGSAKIPVPDWPEGTPPATKLKDFVHAFLQRMVGTQMAPWQTQLVMREMLDPSPACRELVQDFIRANFGLLLRILDEILPSNTPHHRRHQIGFSIIGQCVHYRTAAKLMALLVDEKEWKEHYQIEQLAEHVSEVCLATLGLAPPIVDQWAGNNQ